MITTAINDPFAICIVCPPIGNGFFLVARDIGTIGVAQHEIRKLPALTRPVEAFLNDLQPP